MLTERPLGYRQLEAGSADMVEATAVYVSILVASAVAMVSPPAIGQTLFNLHSEDSLFSTHVDDDESAGYVNCFPGCKSLEMCAMKCTAAVGHPAILLVGPSQTVNYDGC
jgi:hypothetical protein